MTYLYWYGVDCQHNSVVLVQPEQTHLYTHLPSALPVHPRLGTVGSVRAGTILAYGQFISRRRLE